MHTGSFIQPVLRLNHAVDNSKFTYLFIYTLCLKYGIVYLTILPVNVVLIHSLPTDANI